MKVKLFLTTLILAGLFLFSAWALDKPSNATENETNQPAVQEGQVPTEQATRDAAVTPNAWVNTTSGPGSEQLNSSVALSDAVPGEVYGVWNEYLTVGPSPTLIGWSPSFLGGVPGSWVPSPLNPAPPPFQSEWNPDIAANPVAAGGYMMVSTGYIFPPYAFGAPDGVFMTPSVGGGAPFAGPVPVMFNTPPINWLDFAVNDYDEGTVSPNFGAHHMAWVEYVDHDGDPDGNGNFYDDPADDYIIWTTYSGGVFPFPAFAPPFSPAGGPMLFPNSMQMFRPSIDVSHSGTPAMPFPGTIYLAHMDVGAARIFIDASELVTVGVPWATIGSVPFTVAPVPVLCGGIKGANSVSLAIHNEPGDPCDGNVYLAWSEFTGADLDIFFSMSVNGGAAWSPPIPVHPAGLPGDQWAPSMTVDPVTGHICIIYYSDQNAPCLRDEVWEAMSVDCGLTWRTGVMSDAGPTPYLTSIVTLPGPYVGDYLGSDITAAGAGPSTSGKFGGIWNDARNGADQDIYFDPDCNCCNHDGIRGDANYDFVLNIADLTYLIDYLFRGGPAPPCPEEADADGNGTINVADLTYMVNFFFKAGPAPLPCP